ncbi:zinc-dependent alcohol dehydrogenase family protein [Rhizobium sp. YIM 134829]|uniref:zinc-dependent alcohol dehydrogenase family protein n=1 Tax=Rhizobium sp. YIM 134829 TaxID=3390453 RepID=UPI00397AAB43
MTAIRWSLAGLGQGAKGLVQDRVEIAAPTGAEVRVRTKAVSLNYRDLLVLDNGMGMDLAFPFVPCSDMAGEVEAVGPDVTRFRPGDKVISTFVPGWIDGESPGSGRNPNYKTLGGFHPGVLAEAVTFPQDWFVQAPKSLSPQEASTLPCAGLTAWFALREKSRIAQGETMLVEGTGGVALFGLAIAKAYGAEIFVTSGQAEKRERALALGADHALAREGWVEEVYRITGDRGIDHILELVGGDHLGRALEAVAVGGRISVIGVLDGFTISTSVGPLLLKAPVLQGIMVGHRRALEDFVAAIDEKGIKPVIEHSYSFDQVPEAFTRLAEGPFGKIVVTL